MPIFKLIFRFDYQINFGIMDNPGSVMKLISDAPDGFWKDLGETIQSRQIHCKTSDPARGIDYSIAVTPQHIVGSIETIEGIEFRDLYRYSIFRTIVELSQNVIDQFDIANITRGGFRTFGLQNVGGVQTSNNFFKPFLKPDLLELVESGLGPSSDYLLAVDGRHDDKISYHYRMGPYNKGEAAKFFEIPFVRDALDDRPEYNLIFDLDLYEESFSIPRQSTSKWFGPLIERAQETTKGTYLLMNGRQE